MIPHLSNIDNAVSLFIFSLKLCYSYSLSITIPSIYQSNHICYRISSSGMRLDSSFLFSYLFILCFVSFAILYAFRYLLHLPLFATLSREFNFYTCLITISPIYSSRIGMSLLLTTNDFVFLLLVLSS